MKHLYELAKEVKEIDITVIYFRREWEDPKFYYCTVPEDAIVDDSKAMHEDFEGFSPDSLLLYAHQPWYRCYEEIDDEAEILDWHISYKEFHLDTDG